MRVPATTLGALLNSLGVDRVGLLKIDIEGAEFDVLEPTDSALRRLDYVTCEFHGFAGAVDALADGLCRAAGLAVLRRTGNADLATFHIGRMG